MSKAYRDNGIGRFVIGRRSAEKFSEVEGIRRSERTGKILANSEARKETPSQLRARVQGEFRKNP